MTTNKHEKGLIVIQLSGGNDYLNTVVPYGDGRYYDFRSTVNIPQDRVLPLDDKVGFNPSMGPMKALWDEGKVAVINGIGYENPNRSHFRSMDIWHTAEPEAIGTEGWLGRAIRDIDPQGENVLTGINFGRGLPRALGCPGVSVASVGDLATYGLFPDVQDEELRMFTLEAFTKMYGAAAGRDPVMDMLAKTGRDAYEGADILRTAPAQYSSPVEYRGDSLSQNARSIAQVFLAGLGTRVYYTQHGSFDTHSGELPTHASLWDDVAGAVGSLMDDLKEHGARGRCRHSRVLRIWPSYQRQRHRQRSRLRRSRLSDWRRGQRRHVRRVPALGGSRPDSRRPPPQQRLPQHLLRNSGKMAWLGPRPHRERQVRAVRPVSRLGWR